MGSIELKFADAVNYIDNNTWMLTKDVEDQLKIMYHLGRFTKQIGRGPDYNEVAAITEHVRNDKSFAYYNLTIPTSVCERLISKINSTPPKINESNSV